MVAQNRETDTNLIRDSFGTCALCEQRKQLRNSHILSEFAYKLIYFDNHKMLTFDPLSPDKIRIEQKGLREPLLCNDCEQLINDQYEKPFKRYWVDGNALENARSDRVTFFEGIDYWSFKLFHLSVLFRAHAASVTPFDSVDLGSHGPVIRKMVLNGDPGPAWLYPIICRAIEFEGKPVDQVISLGNPMRLHDRRGYMFLFLGVEWCYMVSNQRSAKLESMALTADGTMPVMKVPPSFHKPYTEIWRQGEFRRGAASQ